MVPYGSPPGQWTLDAREVNEGLEELGTGYSILETLPAALFVFLKFPDDFTSAVCHVVHAGDNAQIKLVLEVKSLAHLRDIISRLKRLKNVTSIQKLNEKVLLK